ncbi:MAG: hypothetical protein QM296_12075 [Bacillota bacterium]|nr:hypothetical protein [Bacillota bacterium]
MTNIPETKPGVISIADAIKIYFEHYPDDVLTRLKLVHRGPFFQYSLVGNNGTRRHRLKLNAQTGEAVKKSAKALKRRAREPRRRDAKALNLENLLPLGRINEIVFNAVPVSTPMTWKLKKKKDRTLWKVKVADENGANLHKVKLDAQDGTLLAMKRMV